MVFLQLAGTAVQFWVTELIQSEIGFPGVLLLSLAAIGIRTRNTALTGSAAVFFVLLMTQA